MAWMFLAFAGLFEVVGVIGMNMITRKKATASFLVFIVGLIMSFSLLSLAMKSIPMGTAYAIWTGIGTVGSGIVGILFYGESKDWRRILFMSMVLSAAIGLKFMS